MVSKYDQAVIMESDPLVHAPMAETDEALTALDAAIAYRRQRVDVLRREIRILEQYRDELSAALAGPA